MAPVRPARRPRFSLVWLLLIAPALAALAPRLLSACSVLDVPTALYPDIQSAVDSAAACDTIMLAPGTYTGPGNRNIDFHGKSLVLTSSGGAEIAATTGSQEDK